MNSSSRLLIGSVALLCCCSIVRSDDAADADRALQATRALCEDVFNHCIMKFKAVSTNVESGRVTFQCNHNNVTFGRVDDMIFCEKEDVYLPTTLLDGRKVREQKIQNQEFPTRDFQRVSVSYQYTKNNVRLADHITVWADYTPSATVRGVANAVKFDNIIAEFGPTGESLLQIVSGKYSAIDRLAQNTFRVNYPTPYGKVSVVVNRNQGQDRVLEISLNQSPSDVYTSLSKGLTLAEIRDYSVCGVTPNGLRSISTVLNFTYSDQSSPDRPFETFDTTYLALADDNKFTSSYKLQLTQYKKCHNAADLESLIIPNLDGMPVQLLEKVPSGNQQLNLTYQDRRIVRQVDGAALQDVVIEQRNHRIWLTVAACVMVGAIVVLGFRSFRRHRNARQGVEPK